MILSNLVASIVVIIGIWLNMAIVKAILGIWLNDDKATLAAFAFSVGSLVGLRPPFFPDDAIIGMLVGVIVAYVGLWWVHFGRARRKATRG